MPCLKELVGRLPEVPPPTPSSSTRSIDGICKYWGSLVDDTYTNSHFVHSPVGLTWWPAKQRMTKNGGAGARQAVSGSDRVWRDIYRRNTCRRAIGLGTSGCCGAERLVRKVGRRRVLGGNSVQRVKDLDL